MRNLCRTDLYYLIRYVFKRTDFDDEWLFHRCREVQHNPNGYLDLWARDHRKSTIITYAKTIQDVLASHGDDPLPGWWENREVTCVIFSFNRPTAKKFLDQIKTEFENNEVLKELFPDILYQNPQRESPKWSLDEGLLVKRQRGNPKEKTIEAYGIIDSMPTGGHWLLRIYDDVITEKVARNPEIIKKATKQWELSLSLGTSGKSSVKGQSRYIGTRYAVNDTYKTIMARKAAKPRLYPATDDGTEFGAPVFLTEEELKTKRREMGLYTFNSQMLQKPDQDQAMGFSKDWLKYYDSDPSTGWNYYIVVDPANEKHKKSDYTVMLLIATGPDQNYYLAGGLRDRLNLRERTKALFDMHRKCFADYGVLPQAVGYEKYGMQSDIEHMEDVMDRDNYRFDITPLGGSMAKNDRIRKLIPIFEDGRFYLPEALSFIDYQGRQHELVAEFIEEEYEDFPMIDHDDIFDCMARIVDDELGVIFPKPVEYKDRYSKKRKRSSWVTR